jgi:hypothetical protein
LASYVASYRNALQRLDLHARLAVTNEPQGLFWEGSSMRFLVLVSAVATVAVAAAALLQQIQDRPTVLAPRRP